MVFDFQYSLRSALRGDVHGFYFLISEAVSSLYLRGISVEFLQGSKDPSPAFWITPGKGRAFQLQVNLTGVKILSYP